MQYGKIVLIIVNWNGKRFLEKCFNALKDQSVKKFDLVFVDNNSSDDSVQYVEQNWPDAHILTLDENRGFAVGNNYGISYALENLDPGTVVLLNNDTVVHPLWLEKLLKGFDHPDVGITTSNIFFYYDYLLFDLVAQANSRVDQIQLGSTQYFPIKVINNESNPVGSELITPFTLFAGEEITVGVPFTESEFRTGLQLTVKGSGNIKVNLNSKPLKEYELKLDSSDGAQVKLRGLTSRSRDIFKVIQNAGTKLVPHHLYFRDVGLFDLVPSVSHTTLSDLIKERYGTTVDAACGCAMALRANLLRDLGGFKEGYFNYYEDTELSFRYFRAGYRTRFMPDAQLSHYFSGTYGKRSMNKVYYGHRNRLWFVREYFGAGRYLYILARHIGATGLRLLRGQFEEAYHRIRAGVASLSPYQHGGSRVIFEKK